MSTTAQLALSFEPGLTARFRTLEDCLQHVVLTHRLGVDGVAAKLDMAPSELSRRLHAHLVAKEGDPSNRPLRVGDMVDIIAATQDHRPLYWMAEKFLGDRDAQRTAAWQQIAMLTPILVGLAEQAGIEMPKTKARR
jgi:hypothetical protein